MTKLVRVSFETERFRFETYGATKEAAHALLRAALKRHAKQYGFPFSGSDIDRWSADTDNMWFAEVRVGTALRDNSKL